MGCRDSAKERRFFAGNRGARAAEQEEGGFFGLNEKNRDAWAEALGVPIFNTYSNRKLTSTVAATATGLPSL